MSLPFDAEQADFYDMFEPNSPKHFFIDMIAQKLHFQMDKKGAESAAVTIIGIDTGGLPDEPEHSQRVFIANRPFVFALVENTSRTILFLGQKTQ